MPVSLSACLYLSVCLPVCLPAWLSACMSVYLSACLSIYGFEFEWGFYALSASKAIFRVRTYNCITYSVRDDDYLMNETRRKPTTGRQSPSLFEKWHGINAQSHRRGWIYQGLWLPSCGALGGKPKCSVLWVGLEPTTHRSWVKRTTNWATPVPHVYICLSLPACLSDCLSVCLSVCLSIFLSLGLSACLSTCLPVWLPICLSVSLIIACCLPVHLPVCLTLLACLSVCLSLYKYFLPLRLPLRLCVCVCVCLSVW